MPSFCRHNRLIQNCPICSREQSIELRPVVSSSTPKVSETRAGASRPDDGAGDGAVGRRAAGSGSRLPHSRGPRITIRQLERGAEDGYRSALVPGLKSSEDAARLAEEIAFAAHRLHVLEVEPPGLLAKVAEPGDVEERTWLAFQIAYLCPLDEDHPFASIEAVATSWASGEFPELGRVRTGPRSAHDATRGDATLAAYRAWATRAGSQALAFGGEGAWTAERRFARAFERLALPGLHRDARYELLVVLGRASVYELRGGALQFGGENEVTLAGKRALGIGDTLLLERRAAELASACEVPLEALDLAFHNWSSGVRHGGGLPPGVEPEPGAAPRVMDRLGL